MSSIEASPPEAITGIEIASASAMVASQVDALEHAVARDVGVDDGGDAGVLEALRDVERGELGGLGPALDRDLAVARIEPDRDAAREVGARPACTSAGSRTAAVPMMTRLTPLSSQPSIVAMSRMPPPSCTGSADGLEDALDRARRSSACRRRRRRDRRRAGSRSPAVSNACACAAGIAVEHGGARHVALLEAHAQAVLQVDGGEDRITASISGNSRSAQARAAGSSRDGTACRRCCRARRSP